MTAQPRIAAVELGGTKTIIVVAQGRRIVARSTLPTTNPGETLGAVRDQLLAWQAQEPFDALGIASFGPLRLDRAAPDFGHILRTPKPGWSGADVTGMIADPIGCPFAIDTDVNGAALAEWHWGAGQGANSLCYVTVGTGVGGGLLIGGQPVHGSMHPEIGHLRLRRVPGDDFPGICPFHGDCLEGLVSGPALEARFGCPGARIPADDARWTLVAQDLAEMAAFLLLAVSPQKLLIGGGIGVGRPFLFPLVRERAAELLAGYLPHADADAMQEIIMAPALGAEAGPLGAVALGLKALNRAID